MLTLSSRIRNPLLTTLSNTISKQRFASCSKRTIFYYTTLPRPWNDRSAWHAGPFLAAAIVLILACAVVAWQIKEPQESTTRAVEARPGLVHSLQAVLTAPEK